MTPTKLASPATQALVLLGVVVSLLLALVVGWGVLLGVVVTLQDGYVSDGDKPTYVLFGWILAVLVTPSLWLAARSRPKALRACLVVLGIATVVYSIWILAQP